MEDGRKETKDMAEIASNAGGHVKIQDDSRKQPWKEWIQQEIGARKKADETEEGRRIQRERIRAYEERFGDCELDGCGQNGNKAG